MYLPLSTDKTVKKSQRVWYYTEILVLILSPTSLPSIHPSITPNIERPNSLPWKSSKLRLQNRKPKRIDRRNNNLASGPASRQPPCEKLGIDSGFCIPELKGASKSKALLERTWVTTKDANYQIRATQAKSDPTPVTWIIVSLVSSYTLDLSRLILGLQQEITTLYHPFFRAKRLFKSARPLDTLNDTYSRSKSSWLSFCISSRSSSLRSNSRRPRFRPL